MKKLYITDLDGTLLTSEASVSDRTKNLINSLIDKGVLFSLATARTHATVSEMFSDVKLNVPLVMMNGVIIYDPTENKVVSSADIPRSAAEKVLGVFEKHGKAPMLYYPDGNKINIYFSDLNNNYQQDYINLRNESGIKHFHYSEKLNIMDHLIYIVTLDPREELQEIYEEITKIDGVNCMFYSDNYTGCYFLEVLSSEVNKGTAASIVKDYIGAEKMIAFGDNLNDIPLFEAADEAYAVSNGHERLKAIADGVIGDNNSDAVATFIYEKENNGV
ncbi:MAG: HAD family hydrolase [Clostridia bacterium]|nr:HAD family hydrolase [Clostridia bacterium]